MVEYLKRAEVEEWLKDICEATESDADYVLSRIDEINPADVAEVVRCKDCRFHTTDPECFDEFEITDKPMMCVGIRYGGVDPDWFCEHGDEMREHP